MSALKRNAISHLRMFGFIRSEESGYEIYCKNQNCFQYTAKGFSLFTYADNKDEMFDILNGVNRILKNANKRT